MNSVLRQKMLPFSFPAVLVLKVTLLLSSARGMLSSTLAWKLLVSSFWSPSFTWNTWFHSMDPARAGLCVMPLSWSLLHFSSPVVSPVPDAILCLECKTSGFQEWSPKYFCLLAIWQSNIKWVFPKRYMFPTSIGLISEVSSVSVSAFCLFCLLS